MSEQDSQDDNAESQTSSRRGLILILGVAVIAVAGGAAVPLFSPIDFSNFSKTTVAADETGANEEVDYIDFPEITVNLNEARHARFLRIHFSLQVPASQKKKIEKDVTKKAPKFNNYIQVYLSDKTLEELSGSFGRNRVSRELRDYFNEVLFEDGIERVQDVLFNDFQVQ
jgi:flagellar protein FliL